jgi:hypothetical protein
MLPRALPPFTVEGYERCPIAAGLNDAGCDCFVPGRVM